MGPIGPYRALKVPRGTYTGSTNIINMHAKKYSHGRTINKMYTLKHIYIYIYIYIYIFIYLPVYYIYGVLGTWYLLLSTWYLVLSTSTWYFVLNTWYLVLGT